MVGVEKLGVGAVIVTSVHYQGLGWVWTIVSMKFEIIENFSWPSPDCLPETNPWILVNSIPPIHVSWKVRR